MAPAKPCAWLLLGLAVPSAGRNVLKGVSWTPMPYKKQQGSGMTSDDFFSDEAIDFWGADGRADLAIMQALGINTVRLYGLDPKYQHNQFLDYAHQLGVGVMPGISEYPYKGAFKQSCENNQYDCHDVIKDSWAQTLKSGFLVDNSYHPALTSLIVINEPDYKMPSFTQPLKWTKTIISAMDGMLSAEKEANVDTSGHLPNFTVAYAFAICTACRSQNTKPGLGQMTELTYAIENPEAYGYTPKNDLKEAYKNRFVNGANVFNQPHDVQTFIDNYKTVFPTTPFFFGEYNAVHFPQKDVLEEVVAMAENEPLFSGFSFFEYQVRYDKGGDEMVFGMFGLGDEESNKDVSLYGDHVTVWCVSEQKDPNGKDSGDTIPGAVAAAFNGTGWGARKPCGVCGTKSNCGPAPAPIGPSDHPGGGIPSLVWVVVIVLALAAGAAVIWAVVRHRGRAARAPPLMQQEYPEAGRQPGSEMSGST